MLLLLQRKNYVANKMSLKHLSSTIIILLSFVCFVSSESRWCRLSDVSLSPSNDGWVQFEDASQSCVACSDQSTRLVDSNKVKDFECCYGILVTIGNCESREGVDSICSAGIQCDAVKQCVDGRDEIGCGECSTTDYFACSPTDITVDLTSNRDACIPPRKICDSRKDCDKGLDETGCEWYGGWCSGFLCGEPHPRCIPMTQVCDGSKQCMDGSDEYNCRHCNRQFRCAVYEKDSVSNAATNTTTAECVGSFRVCDGIQNCMNGLDETNCFRWREWSTWSECDPPTVCVRTRDRVCIDADSAQVNPQKCYDVEDYHEENGTPPVERQTSICPPCIPTRVVTTTTPTPTTTAQPMTTRPTTTQSTTTQPATTQPATTQPTTTQPTTTQPTTTQPTTTQPTTTQPTTTQPTTTQPTTTQPTTTQPTTAQPTSTQPTTTQPTTTQPTTTQPTTTQPTTTQPTTTQPTTTQPTTTQTTSTQPTTTQSTTTQLSVEDQTNVASKAAGSANRNEKVNAIDGTGLDGFYNKPTKLPIFALDTLSTGANISASNVTTPAIDLHKSSIGFTLIIAASVVAAIVFILVIFCLLFCCSEKRRKTGKWIPRRLLYKGRPIKVPQMYHDIQIGDVAGKGKRLPTTQTTAQPQTLSSFSAVTGVSGVDSGIDDANSTTSSFEAAHHARQLSIPAAQFTAPPYGRETSCSHLVDAEVHDDEFPPPPPQFDI